MPQVTQSGVKSDPNTGNTHRYFAPGAADGNDVLLLKQLLLEALPALLALALLPAPVHPVVAHYLVFAVIPDPRVAERWLALKIYLKG